MTTELEKEKPKNLDSLSFPVVKSLLERMCKSLGFRLSHRPLNIQPTWLLDVDDDTVVFLDGRDRDEFPTAKDLLAGILNSRIFMLRSIKTFEERTIQNPLYSLDLIALEIKLDLLLA